MDRPLQTQQDSIRLALYQEPETSLPGGSYGSNMGQAYVNCFPIVYKNQITGETDSIVVKRQGCSAVADFTPTIASYGTSDSMTCICNMVITQLYDVYVGAWFDANNSKIYVVQYRPISGTTIKIGEISGCNRHDTLFITEITNGDTLLPGIAVSYQKFDKSSGTGYYAVSSAGVMTSSSLTTISHASFPANLGTPRIITGPFQYMNGHSYIMTLDGFIYMSSLTTAQNPDITTWNTLATVTASQYPDGGIGVFRYKHHLLAFGKDSIEFFNDASNPPPGSTLERTDQAFIKFGAVTPRLIQNFDDSIYWIGYGSNDSFGVWKMTGYAPEKISDIKIDQALMDALTSAADWSWYNMQCAVLGARKHLILNGITYYTAANFLTSNVADTYPITSSGSCRGNACVYSLDDRVWWGLNIGSAWTNAGTWPRLATSYGTSAQVGNYRQYMFLEMDLSGDTGSEASTCRALYFNQTTQSAGGYLDSNPSSAFGGTSLPITITVSTNTYWFQTERRKRVNKIKAIIEGLTANDASVYALYIIATPDSLYNSLGTTSQVRRIVIPTQDQRYYDNNWGMMRAINVTLVSRTLDDMRIRAVEIDLAQGTN